MTKQEKYRIAVDWSKNIFVQANINGVWTRITENLGNDAAAHAKAQEIIRTMK